MDFEKLKISDLHSDISKMMQTAEAIRMKYNEKNIYVSSNTEKKLIKRIYTHANNIQTSLIALDDLLVSIEDCNEEYEIESVLKHG